MNKNNASTIDGLLSLISKLEVESVHYNASVIDGDYLLRNVDILLRENTSLLTGSMDKYASILLPIIALESSKKQNWTI